MKKLVFTLCLVLGSHAPLLLRRDVIARVKKILSN